MSHPTPSDWQAMSPEELGGTHRLESYRGWQIELSAPNGGILAIDLWQGTEGFTLDTEPWNKYKDQEWHEEVARQMVDFLESRKIPEGQLTLLELTPEEIQASKDSDLWT